MRMSDFVIREAIVPDLKANAKEAVIREMVTSLRDAVSAGRNRTLSGPLASMITC